MQKRKKILKGLVGLAFSAALLFAVQELRGPLSGLGSKSFKLPVSGVPEATSQPLREGRKAAWGSAGLSDSMLIDSILTIIQNYYVDESRVDNDRLLEGTLRALEEQDYFKVAQSSPEEWTISKNGESLGFRVETPYEYDELMRDCIRLSQFIDRHRSERMGLHKPVPSGAFLLLNAMLSGLDPHSNLLNQEEYRDLRQGTEGSFGGLGVVVGMQDEVLTVIKPLPKSPAARAGVAKADRIMQIDNKSTFGTTLDDLIQYMRGEPGTRVNLSVLREGENAPRPLSLTREIIQVDSVEARMIAADRGPVFYANIDSFSSRTAAELREALLKAQQKSENISGIVLDLRSNPGGLLDQAVKVSDLFLDEGRIVSTQGRTREFEMAKQNLYHFDYPILILTNGDTASASEIVAGALRDHGRALVIGEPSFGKGSVQTVFELPGEQALKLTIARYFTPRGISIQNIGIVPDIWLQPIYPANENVNLLGDYRYKSERFLDHSLDQNKVRAATGISNEWKAYYLEEKETPKKAKQDVPLSFALKLLDDLARHDGVPLPPERLRASYWKASTSKLARKLLQDLNQNAANWLSQTKRVTWNDEGDSSQLAAEKGLKFQLDIPDRQRIKEGLPIDIPWRMRNNGATALHRLSVFVTGNSNAIATSEVLVGTIAPGQEIKGVLRYDMKIDAKESPLRMRAGVARSGWPLSGKERSFWVELQDSAEPEFSMKLSMLEEKGGRLKGVLEPGESAKIELLIRNSSQIPAHQLEVKLVNLAGKQVVVEGPRFRIKQMAPGETRVLHYVITATRELASTQLQLGAVVSGAELLTASKEHFFITSEPATRMSKMDAVTGSESWKKN